MPIHRKPSPRHTLHSLILRGIFLGTFALVSGVLVVDAMGFRLNVDQLKLEQTGAIHLDGDTKDVNVYMDNELVGSKIPITLTRIRPAYGVLLRVSKEDYIAWERRVVVEPGLVTSVGPIRLWLVKPEVSDTPNASLNTCKDSKPFLSDALTISNGDIRLNNVLVSRFSSPIVEACWFGDQNHLLVATNHAVSIIERDGNTVTAIFSSDETIAHIDIDKSANVVYVQVGTVWKKVVVAN